MQLGFAPVNAWGIASFIFMLLCYSFGAVLIFVNMLALRQAVTPEGLMGRMTSTVRWLMLIPAGPGALLGGYIGEHFGLRYTLVGAGLSSIILAAWAWRYSILAGVAVLPSPQNSSVGAGDTASVRT
jgi:MFS family permease